MTADYLNVKTIDKIIQNMIETVDHSKTEIFEIGEQSRNDYMSIIDEIKKIKKMVIEIIEEEEALDREVRKARKRLSEVSKYFNKYSEEEVRRAYEHAHNSQVKLTMTRQIEKQLRNRRDELERRIVGIQETIERADR